MERRILFFAELYDDAFRVVNAKSFAALVTEKRTGRAFGSATLAYLHLYRTSYSRSESSSVSIGNWSAVCIFWKSGI